MMLKFDLIGGIKEKIRHMESRTLISLILTAIVVFIAFYTYRNYREYVIRHGYSADEAVGCDFRFYYEAGRGNFEFRRIQNWYGTMVEFRYFYPRWTASFFFWCRFIEYEQAYLLWSMFLTICFIILVWEACKYGFAGTVMAVVGIKFFSICIGTGNIIPLLALLALNPVSCLLAACFKPWIICFLPLHFLVALRQHSPEYHCDPVEVYRKGVRLSVRTASFIIVPAVLFIFTYEKYYRLILAGLPSVRPGTFVKMLILNLWR